MKHTIRHSFLAFGALLVAGAVSTSALAQPIFFDNFEDRVIDQPTLGNNWTWYDQAFTGNACGENFLGGSGPCDNDGDCNNDYEQDNRNFENAGGDDSYYRAGLEVPAWDGALSNMLRVYGNQYASNGDCQRTLIFQEMTIEEAATMVFSFDVAKDQYGAPANGEITAGFVKVIKTSDFSYDELLFVPVETMLDENTLTDERYIEFEVTEEMVGELLQFGFYNDVVPGLGQSWATAGALYDNITLDVAAIGPAHSGSFYNVDQAGHGFSAEFGIDQGAPTAVIFWYTYDNLGNPIFFIGQDAVFDGNTVEITFYSPTGMIFGEFDPTPVFPLDVAGTATFVFSDSSNATFSYTPSEFSINTWGHSAVTDLPLVKLFGIPADRVFPLSQ
jgi:hypothetical protein